MAVVWPVLRRQWLVSACIVTFSTHDGTHTATHFTLRASSSRAGLLTRRHFAYAVQEEPWIDFDTSMLSPNQAFDKTIVSYRDPPSSLAKYSKSRLELKVSSVCKLKGAHQLVDR